MKQAWDFVEKEEVTKEREEARGDKDSKGCYLTKLKGTLSPELASRVTGLLLPAAVTLLEALVDSSKLEDAMKDQQEAVCLCMGQAIAQVGRLVDVLDEFLRSCADTAATLHWKAFSRGVIDLFLPAVALPSTRTD